MVVKEEIEYLTEDKDRYKELFHQAVRNRDEFVALADTKQKQCEIMSKNYDILYNEKVELQKQVEELKEKNKQLIDDGYIYQRKYELLEHEFDYLKSRKNDGIREAVKYTAKEIFTELFYMASIHHSDVANILAWAKEKAKSKGVEVEQWEVK